MTLSPTHQCFDDALDFIDKIVKLQRHKLEDWRLCHALCRAPEGIFAHAWCERDEIVVVAFMINGVHTYLEIDHAGFYDVFEPFDVIRYTISEAARLNYQSGHYGPWDPRMQTACSDRHEILGSREVHLQ
jgi:hypothetical protein